MITTKGIELIAEERREQIEKHGFSLIEDAEYYKQGELVQAAIFAIDQTNPGHFLTVATWPKEWDQSFAEKICRKDAIGKLKVAGALIAAEIDRLELESERAD